VQAGRKFILSDKRSLMALRFFRRYGVKVHRVMTDNGVSFRSHRYAKALRL